MRSTESGWASRWSPYSRGGNGYSSSICEGLVFLAILIAGVGFEVLWRLRHGTNALVERAVLDDVHLDAGQQSGASSI